MKNLWFNKIIAFAYQYQKEARPYKELINDFSSFINLRGNEIALDIGCGSGKIMRLIWEKSKGRIKKIIGLDCSQFALEYAKKNLIGVSPIPGSKQLDFSCWDISQGLNGFEQNSIDLITAGLSIQYAEHWDGKHWTQEAYKRIIKDVYAVLRSGGRFVFSVNVPKANFAKIAKESWREIFLTWKLPIMIVVAAIMVWQGKWLTKQANIGRFHYLPIEEVKTILQNVGFQGIEYKLTYANLAWVVSCQKPI